MIKMNRIPDGKKKRELKFMLTGDFNLFKSIRSAMQILIINSENLRAIHLQELEKSAEKITITP